MRRSIAIFSIPGYVKINIADRSMPTEVLLEVEPVSVEVPVHDLPGPSRFKATCQRCGVVVRDRREVFLNGIILGRACAGGTYYRPADAATKRTA
jgi:formylmethanofuran dehydrogenase subunit E